MSWGKIMPDVRGTMGRSEVRGTMREKAVMEDSSRNNHSQAVLDLSKDPGLFSE